MARDGDAIVLRNSRRPESERIQLTLEEWKAFSKGLLNGEFLYD